MKKALVFVILFISIIALADAESKAYGFWNCLDDNERESFSFGMQAGAITALHLVAVMTERLRDGKLDTEFVNAKTQDLLSSISSISQDELLSILEWKMVKARDQEDTHLPEVITHVISVVLEEWKAEQ